MYHPIAGALLVLTLLILYSGCGRKGPPIPPKAYVPLAIKDLKADVNETSVKLTWTTVPEKKKKRISDSVFVLYSAKQSLDSDICEGCPNIFTPIDEISFDNHVKAIKSGQTIIHELQVEPGYRYEFKIKIQMKNNVSSPFSNRVSVDIP